MLSGEGVSLLISIAPKLKIEEAISIAVKYYGLGVVSCKNLGSGMKDEKVSHL